MATLLSGLLLTTQPISAEVIGTDGFDYPNGSIIGQMGGTGWDWDNTIPAHSGTNSDWTDVFGIHSVLNGELITAGGGALREYNGPTEGSDAGPPETDERLGAFRGTGAVYYGADFRIDGAPAWAGMSSYDFGAERIFYGMPGGQAESPMFGIEVTGVGLSFSTVPVVFGQTYRLVSVVDFDGDEVRLWVDPDSSDFDNGTGDNSADVTRAYTGSNWSTSVRLASGADTAWDNLIATTAFSDFDLPDAILPTLRVNTTTGDVSIRNDSGSAIDLNGYAILSAGNALNKNGWNSLQDQNLPDFPAGNGTGNGWEETGTPDLGYLGEAYLLDDSTLADTLSIDLGSAFNPLVFGRDHDGDLVFDFRRTDGEVVSGIVEYVTGGVVGDADFDADGDVDGTDFLTWQRGFGAAGGLSQGDANGDGTVNESDLVIWENQFGTGGTPAGGSAGTAVPEPSTLALVGLLLGLPGLVRRRHD